MRHQSAILIRVFSASHALDISFTCFSSQIYLIQMCHILYGYKSLLSYQISSNHYIIKNAHNALQITASLLSASPSRASPQKLHQGPPKRHSLRQCQEVRVCSPWQDPYERRGDSD
ncbi:hypothetical protein FGO68_gene5319 [Halteria grandinella]|uniref:Uncharacterized protein n=1 Tax=Halteria grandinella TaxID=5974 RepID=A0A8J8SU24_HALGN|nr:hypothetical protein FGO68_gene5319 [Halteria grandinella]